MFFNSIDFAVFLPIVFILYWFVFNKNLRLQNFFLLVVSYVFYGWWDWKFLSLIVFSSFVDYYVGIALEKDYSQKKRKFLLLISLIVNLGLLGVFKYYNFFIDNLHSAFTLFGSELNLSTINIILPVGISFYTFQTLSYSIDVYRRKLKHSDDLIAFFAYVAFFPQLVAGPIERATNLLPQFFKSRKFDYDKAKDGMRQILWGLFKKIVIADNCAVYADQMFNNPDQFQGITLVLGAVYFAVQIYCDFSGYSDIAIGTAKLFNFDLMINFRYPYFSRDIAEFWRRWHISLSTWFRDYLYIPLGGSKGSKLSQIRNVFIIFLVSGFWHGANWTFLAWGFLNALYFLPLMLIGKNRTYLNNVSEGKFFPYPKEALQILLTFSLSTFAWIFFRAKDISSAFYYIGSIFDNFNLQINSSTGIKLLPIIVLLFGIEWFQRDKDHSLDIRNLNVVLRWSIYLVIILLTVSLGKYENQSFIYFQF